MKRIARRITVMGILLFLLADLGPGNGGQAAGTTYAAESDPEAAAEVTLQRVFNFRDLGGQQTADRKHTVKKGILYRSGELTFASDEDLAALGRTLGIKTVIDLRYPQDRKYCPDKKVPGAKNVFIPLRGVTKKRNAKAGRKAKARRKAFKKLAKTASSAEFLGKFAATSHKIKLKRTYAMFTSKASRKSMKKYFKILLSNKAGSPLLVHCIQGKDRTGVVCSVTLLALGVSEKTVIDEYCRSNGAYKDVNSTAYGGPEYGVRKSDIQYCLRTIKKKYGSYEKFLKKAYGLKKSDLTRLRAIYLE